MAPPSATRYASLTTGESWLLKLSRAALLCTLACFAVILWGFRHNPPLNTDSLIYHLSIPALWLQNGLFSAVDLPFHDGAAEHSPMLTQLLAYLLMRLTGDAGLTWLIQPLFLLVLLRFFFLSLRTLGLGRPPALALTALLLLFPPFLNSANITNNELALTCGCAIALYGLLRMPVGFRAGLPWVAVGIALLLATKHVGVIYAGVIVVLFAAACIARRVDKKRQHNIAQRTGGPGGPGIWQIVLALVVVLLGSSFLLKSWLLYGNPMYPASIALGPVPLFDGLYDSSVLIDHGWSMDALRLMLVRADGAPFAVNPPTSMFLWLGAAISLLAARRHGRSGNRWSRLAVTVLFPLAATLLFFAVVPFWREHRLLFPVYYAFWLAAGNALAILQRRFRSQRRASMIVPAGMLLLLVMQLVKLGPMIPGWSLLLAPVMLVLAALNRQALSRRRLIGGVAAALVVAAAAVVFCYPTYRDQRLAKAKSLYPLAYGPAGAAWVHIDDLTTEQGGLTIAYTETPIIFPLFGQKLQNRVLYIPLSADDRPQAIDLQPGDSIYRRLAQTRRRRVDEAFWLAKLAEEDVDLLYLADESMHSGTARAELDIINRHRDRFELLFQADTVLVFRVRKP